MYIAVNPFIDAYLTSDVFGKLIFIALFLLSIISWILLVNKMMLTRSLRKLSKEVRARFEKQKQSPLNIELQTFGNKEIPNPFVEMYKVLKNYTLEILNKNQWVQKNHGIEDQAAFLSQSDISLLEAQLALSIDSQVCEVEKHLFILPTVVTLAPFLGLLGTVWGILLTFSSLQAQSFSGNNQVVLGGLSMALATTVIGLVVAIPALIAYNYLKSSIRHYETEMDEFSGLMLFAVEIQYRKVELH